MLPYSILKFNKPRIVRKTATNLKQFKLLEEFDSGWVILLEDNFTGELNLLSFIAFDHKKYCCFASFALTCKLAGNMTAELMHDE